MSIRRSARKQSYTVIDNAVFTSGLSYRAIGILCFLLSKPDNWEVSVAHLVNTSRESAAPTGRDGVYSTLKELQAKGFISRESKRGEAGKLDGVEYVVHDQPLTDEPLTDEPYTAEPTQVSTEYIVNTEGSNKPIVSSDDETGDSLPSVKPTRVKKPAYIREIWNQYPEARRGGTDQHLWKKWKVMRLTEADATDCLRWLLAASQVWSVDARFAPGLTKFVDEQRWRGPLPELSKQTAQTPMFNDSFIDSGDDLL